jgi:hypothetical protein
MRAPPLPSPTLRLAPRPRLLPQISYLFVTCGIAYDIIQEPPAFGAEQDPKTGGLANFTAGQ